MSIEKNVIQPETPFASERVAPGTVWVERTGTRTFIGDNGRGDKVLIGPDTEPGHFRPGELLKLALIGCAGMSMDAVVARRLGEDFPATLWAHGVADPNEDRYDRIAEEIALDLASLDEAEQAKLRKIISAALDKSCTVARSVKGAIELDKTIAGEPTA
ncbi:OsmC family protein [Micrococcales bacterium 31B]|nr:OsmC family protein [Micrococcales bacterium 31B]